jgi:uncharacterized ion transporter superfamily protein YfcC
VFVPLGVHHVWRYATRVKQDPSRSLVADMAPPPMERPHEATPLTATHRLVLLARWSSALGVLIWGLTRAAGTSSR